MNSRTRTATQLSRFLVLALFLALAPAASASTTWYVDGVNGNDSNDCLSSQTACQTIGHTISLCSKGDSIMVAPAVYVENLTINTSLKILGSDAATTIVDGNMAGTAFKISNPRAHVRLSKLTIRNGGGIDNYGMLTVNDSTISGNNAYVAIYSHRGMLTINNSTVSGNTVEWAGIFHTGGTLTINNSTINGNSRVGVVALAGGTINNSTISGNGQDGVWNDSLQLTVSSSTISGNHNNGLFNYTSAAATTLQNSIVANNPGGNCSGTVISNGYNLSSDDTCNLTGPGDMSNTDPKLRKLGNHGGPTQTMSLLPGSPAIDAGNPNGCTDDKGNPLKTDQRGWPRPGKHDTGACDIGAFERQRD
jgi:hypothetical protein